MYGPDTIETQERKFNLNLDDVDSADMSEPEREVGRGQSYAQSYRSNA
jgi:hypothetical protein